MQGEVWSRVPKEINFTWDSATTADICIDEWQDKLWITNTNYMALSKTISHINQNKNTIQDNSSPTQRDYSRTC